MNEGKLTRDPLQGLAPNNSDKAYRERTKIVITPGETPKKDVGQERKKLQPIVKGAVVRKKAGTFEKLKTTFLGENVNLGEYVLFDVLVPAFRNTMSDMGFGLIEMVFGNGRERRRYGSDSGRVIRDRGRSYVDYRGASSGSSRDRGGRGYDDGRREFSAGDRGKHDFDRIEFTSRGEAEDVLSHLVDLVEEYGEATVAAFYELSNIESEHVDNNYGWTNLRDAYTERGRNCYIIRFPQPRPLK